MAADSGRVNRFSGDCIIELLMRIHRYTTDRDKHTMLKCRSKIRFGELSWNGSASTNCIRIEILSSLIDKSFSLFSITLRNYSFFNKESDSIISLLKGAHDSRHSLAFLLFSIRLLVSLQPICKSNFLVTDEAPLLHRNIFRRRRCLWGCDTGGWGCCASLVEDFSLESTAFKSDWECW